METENSKALEPNLISVRDLQVEDVPFILNYWFRSPPGFIEAMGVDLEKLPEELFMKEHLTKRFQYNQTLAVSKLNALAILYKGQAVGFHTLVPMTEGESGIFHAHIWQADMRGKGIGSSSYPLACGIFMKRFNLQKIVFKTPQQNTGAIKVKEKLGIRRIGQEIIGFDILRDGTVGIVFEWTREECLQK